MTFGSVMSRVCFLKTRANSSGVGNCSGRGLLSDDMAIKNWLRRSSRPWVVVKLVGAKRVSGQKVREKSVPAAVGHKAGGWIFVRNGKEGSFTGGMLEGRM